jgi:hypothetical protein
MLRLKESGAATDIAKRFAPLPEDVSTSAVVVRKPILKPFTATLPWHDAQQGGANIMLSLSEAATAVGLAKSTIWRAIKSGRISANKADTGNYQVAPAELFRVFPAMEKTAATKQDAIAADAAEQAARAAAALDAQIVALKDVNALLREQLNDTRTDRDAWRQQAEANQRLLAGARPRRSLFGWS